MLVTAFLFALALDQAPTGSISGTVRDSAGQAVAGVTMRLDNAQPAVSTATDVSGYYTFRGLAAGHYNLYAMPPRPSHNAQNRLVYLKTGEEITGEDFRLANPATITGRVLDYDKKPLAGVTVSISGLIYIRQTLRHQPERTTTTGKDGEFRLEGLKPGREYLLAASARHATTIMPGHLVERPKSSEIPARTYYPNSPTAEGVQPLVLRPGEVRDGIDFRMAPRPSVCLDGVVTGAPTELEVTVETDDPLPSWPIIISRGKTNSKGVFTLCGLSPGRFRARTMHYLDSVRSLLYAATPFEIPARPGEMLRLDLTPTMSIAGETVWLEDPAPRIESPSVQVIAQPAAITLLPGESFIATATIPGEFTLAQLSPVARRLTLGRLPRGVYARSATLGTADLLNEPFYAGSAARLHIVLAADGAYVRVQAVDAKGVPMRDAIAAVFPDGKIATDGDMARWVIPFPTAGLGRAVTSTLPPGRYRVLAVYGDTETTPAMMHRLFDLRGKAAEVELTSGAVKDVTVQAQPLFVP